MPRVGSEGGFQVATPPTRMHLSLDVCTKIDTIEPWPMTNRGSRSCRSSSTELIRAVREWLKSLPKADRCAIGEDLKTAQYGWPLGMPLVRKLEPRLWEVRSRTGSGIARVIFTVSKALMILLHGFVKKSQKTPPGDLDTARQRLADLE